MDDIVELPSWIPPLLRTALDFIPEAERRRYIARLERDRIPDPHLKFAGFSVPRFPAGSSLLRAEIAKLILGERKVDRAFLHHLYQDIHNSAAVFLDFVIKGGDQSPTKVDERLTIQKIKNHAAALRDALSKLGIGGQHLIMNALATPREFMVNHYFQHHRFDYCLLDNSMNAWLLMENRDILSSLSEAAGRSLDEYQKIIKRSDETGRRLASKVFGDPRDKLAYECGGLLLTYNPARSETIIGTEMSLFNRITLAVFQYALGLMTRAGGLRPPETNGPQDGNIALYVKKNAADIREKASDVPGRKLEFSSDESLSRIEVAWILAFGEPPAFIRREQVDADGRNEQLP